MIASRGAKRTNSIFGGHIFVLLSITDEDIIFPLIRSKTEFIILVANNIIIPLTLVHLKEGRRRGRRRGMLTTVE